MVVYINKYLTFIKNDCPVNSCAAQLTCYYNTYYLMFCNVFDKFKFVYKYKILVVLVK